MAESGMGSDSTPWELWRGLSAAVHSLMHAVEPGWQMHAAACSGCRLRVLCSSVACFVQLESGLAMSLAFTEHLLQLHVNLQRVCTIWLGMLWKRHELRTASVTLIQE